MGKLVVYMSMSLDGFVAATGDGPGVGLGVGGEPLHAWLTAGNVDPTSFRPERGVNAEVFDEMLATGAVVTGRHTFDWAGQWSGDHHDGVPVFVLTHDVPTDPDGPIVHHVSDPAEAVARAKAAAGDRDVMMHGASAVQALLRGRPRRRVRPHPRADRARRRPPPVRRRRPLAPGPAPRA